MDTAGRLSPPHAVLVHQFHLQNVLTAKQRKNTVKLNNISTKHRPPADPKLPFSEALTPQKAYMFQCSACKTLQTNPGYCLSCKEEANTYFDFLISQETQTNKTTCS